MSLRLGAIADDYTGASDLANTLHKNGLRTVQTVGVPAQSLALPEVDAVVVSLKIRSVKADEAIAAARKADTWLRGLGARHVLYKICSTFDSTDAGNIGPVTEALAQDAGATSVIVTPAFPETGRTVYRGHLFVGDQLLSESPLKDHPLNPMHDANLVRVLGRQAKASVGLLDLATIGSGSTAISQRLQALAERGCPLVIADAISEADLERIGEVAVQARVSTGASGLGLGLARALVRSGNSALGSRTSANDAEPVGGLAACVSGSCSKRTLEQVAEAERVMPVLRLDTDRLLSSQPDEEIHKALGWAKQRLHSGAVLIAASAEPQEVAALQAKYGRDASGLAIEAATSAIAAELVACGVKRLVVAGGETSGAAVDRLLIPAFLIEQEIAPGVPILRTIGRAGPAMRLALKSGNFGTADFFQRAINLMR